MARIGEALWRAAVIAGGCFLLVVNNFYRQGDNTFLGFYGPTSAERLGADIGTFAITWLALWLIYRGIGIRWKPRVSQTKP